MQRYSGKGQDKSLVSSHKFFMKFREAAGTYEGKIIMQGCFSEGRKWPEDNVLKTCQFGFYGSPKNDELCCQIFEYRFGLTHNIKV